ncbi:MAG: TetR/AcrR family transcriptional regulator [Micrococcales bacterium]
MARPKGDAASNAARRQDILKAAFDVFSMVGYTSGSLSQIAEIVGMTEAGILHHFKTKANLLTAVLEYRDALTRDQFGVAKDSGIDFVKSWLSLIDYNVSIPGMIELFCVISAEATKENHPAHAFFKNRYSETIELAKAAMADLQKNGHVYQDLNPEDLGRALVALSDGLQVQWLLDRKWDMIEEHKAFFRRILKNNAHELVGL